ncbi:AraC family transcriptional regulator [Maribacter sp. HTCC2170]|uniref:AraC family transcriptional regulator n=1 Tax=Maribacter sp. (strain HTCC2170 / KCCM 42371) TaxID=313603 RepID=UPI00006AFCC2|nr:AraC family transcriptional regulator [Maribacter sp. HTCC2170]EAR01163.1 putative AraC-family transcriptional regulator [Maribacter sp. HTCC2170]
MKVLPFKIPKPLNQNLIVQVDESKMFYNQLHQHEELQLSLVVRGSGKMIVGDSVHQFSAGDFFVIGSNCPHLFQSEESTESVKMISLFFTSSSFGNDFFNLPDLSDLRSFFDQSTNGFSLTSNQLEVSELMNEIPKQDKLTRFIKLLGLLKIVNKSERRVLTNFINPKKIGTRDGQRLQIVYDFVINNFQNEISLNTVSELVFMTPNAFCRFFKVRTNKTLFQFLIELRLEHACQLLQHSGLSIAEIAEQSGFNSISNFNRQFKSQKGISPSLFIKNNQA